MGVVGSEVSQQIQASEMQDRVQDLSQASGGKVVKLQDVISSCPRAMRHVEKVESLAAATLLLLCVCWRLVGNKKQRLLPGLLSSMLLILAASSVLHLVMQPNFSLFLHRLDPQGLAYGENSVAVELILVTLTRVALICILRLTWDIVSAQEFPKQGKTLPVAVCAYLFACIVTCYFQMRNRLWKLPQEPAEAPPAEWITKQELRDVVGPVQDVFLLPQVLLSAGWHSAPSAIFFLSFTLLRSLPRIHDEWGSFLFIYPAPEARHPHHFSTPLSLLGLHSWDIISPAVVSFAFILALLAPCVLQNGRKCMQLPSPQDSP